jgi:hypothetical protein
MKIISVDVARTTWLFPITELNSAGRSLTNVFLQMRDKYKFKKFPTHTVDTDPQTNALVFDQGEFRNRNGILVLVKMTIFNDGIVADCYSSTRDSDDFLKDLMNWIKTEQNLSLPPDRVIKTLYLSELTVSTGKGLAWLNPRMEEFARKLSEKMSSEGRENAGYTFGGFALWPRDWNRLGAPAHFRFELKLASQPGDL